MAFMLLACLDWTDSVLCALTYYCVSTPLTLMLAQMALIRVFLIFWVLGRDALRAVSALAREVLTRLAALPGLILPKASGAITTFVSRTYSFERFRLYAV